ncbi:MAG: hypothetical protein HQM13_07840 [SAR324 cluster bacterium]|nr:hypothetical protein [SAR324 cluster bacterium]
MAESRFETYFNKEDSGKVVFEAREDCLEEIDKHLNLIENLKKSEDIAEELLPALGEIHYQIQSLKYSDIPLAEVKKKINQYSRVPLGDGKFMHLSSFLGSTGEQKVVKSEEEYLAQVQKMVENTKANLTNLMIFKEDDEHLKGFAEELDLMDGSHDFKSVKTRMEHLAMSGIIKHYNQVKLEFLRNWLAPFEEQLGKPIAQMSSDEVQKALGKVENLKKQQLEDIGMRMNPELFDDFRPYNRTMHELMNGDNADFWGFPQQRDEFVELIKKIINRFSFKLEKHYLIFQSADKKMAYLVGFPDTAYEGKKELKGSKIGLIPHLKVFFAGKDGNFKELTRDQLEKSSEYYRVLKTAVVPFLASLATIVETPLSQEFKDAFDMWL